MDCFYCTNPQGGELLRDGEVGYERNRAGAKTDDHLSSYPLAGLSRGCPLEPDSKRLKPRPHTVFRSRTQSNGEFAFV